MMNRIYRSVFWLALVYMGYGVCQSYGAYGKTWHFDAWCLPETIADPGEPPDSLNAAGRRLEKPLWVVIYLGLFICSAMLCQVIREDARRRKRRAIFATFDQRSKEIDKRPESEQFALRRQNVIWLKRQLGRRYWNRYHRLFEPFD